MPGDAPKFALLTVTGTELVTPRMMRVRFGGHDLTGFRSVSPDQQAKFFFAKPGQRPEVPPMPDDGNVMTWFQAYRSMPEPRRPWMRSYSIRAHHPDSGEIDVDFVLHEHPGGLPGPATSWARKAAVGDQVGMLGPAKSHFVTPGPHDWRLLVGDESALPAIAALLEDADDGVPTIACVEVVDAGEEQPLTGADIRWLHRGDVPAGRSELLVEAVRAATFPPGTPFAWLAGESSAVRALRRHLVGERGVDRKQVAFSGYWRLHLTQDDDPTAEDVAERAEVLAQQTG